MTLTRIDTKASYVRVVKPNPQRDMDVLRGGVVDAMMDLETEDLPIRVVAASTMVSQSLIDNALFYVDEYVTKMLTQRLTTTAEDAGMRYIAGEPTLETFDEVARLQRPRRYRLTRWLERIGVLRVRYEDVPAVRFLMVARVA